MKKALLSFILGFIVLGAAFIPLAFADAPAITTPKPAAYVKNKHEHHPEFQRAIHKLRAAKADLEKEDVLSWHQTKAIQDIDHAIEEIRLALNSDKK